MGFKESIQNYIPFNEVEAKDKENILIFLDSFENVLTRENTIGHLTASSWIVNKERTKVLMAYHNIFDSWAFSGGHVDGDADLLHVALKEAKEETGIEHIYPVSDNIFGLDIISVHAHIKKGQPVSSHLHFNVIYLLEADESDMLQIKEDENSAVGWIDIDEVQNVVTEKEMLQLYLKYNQKLVKEKL